MSLKRKTAALAAAVFLVCGTALAGCGKKEDNPETVYCSIQNEGYGYRWLEAVAKLYTERTGLEVKVAPASVEGQVSSQLLNAKNNNTDLYFNISGAETFFGNLAKGSTVAEGYDTLFADISDVYDRVPEGYNGETVRELITPYALRSNTYNGKQYGFSWSNGINGLVYNADLFAEYGIEPPRTTDELLNVCATVNAKYKTDGGRTIYAFNWATGYWYHLTMLWWFQYEGADAYTAYCEGKDVGGQYTAEIVRQRGKYYALDTIQKIVDIKDGYSNPNCTSYSFTQQLRFLEGEAFMMPNGDWLEREMESNFEPGEVTIKMMRTPVNSRIIDKLPRKTITDDKELREVVDYIDGGHAVQGLRRGGRTIRKHRAPYDFQSEQHAPGVYSLVFQQHRGRQGFRRVSVFEGGAAADHRSVVRQQLFGVVRLLERAVLRPAFRIQKERRRHSARSRRVYGG